MKKIIKKNQFFIIKIEFDVDDDYDRVHNYFKYHSVNINFYHSFIPPHKVEYIIEYLSETGVQNWKKHLDEQGFRYKMFVADYDQVKTSANGAIYTNAR